ncbi:hypothetical protein BOX15_Mlig007090g1 [Macrostomum lignano]|uniref:WSC domain-containing protein n=1 Tax=Macrostomum lignano TaxID=282301 RepID=A0A267F8P2_9PLAT|nr:hypothetical protein BOX15_Mlig007090g1 [Macrostomum lignano]
MTRGRRLSIIEICRLVLLAIVLLLSQFTGNVLGCSSAIKKKLDPDPVTVHSIPALGCYSDSEKKRDLPDYVGRYQHMRKHLCNSFCLLRGAKYFGMQDTDACFCGNSYGRLGRVTEVYCPAKCPGEIGESCGGKTYNSIYEVTEGVPLVKY